MKKTLIPAFALPLVCAILFSCQSTDGAASLAAEQNAAEASAEAQESAAAAETDADGASLADESAAAYEEKIPQSEMDEFTALLDDGQESAESQESAPQEEASVPLASQESAPQESAASQEERSASLAEKIKASNGSESAPKDTSVALAPLPAADSAGKSSNGADLTRLTDQKKEIAGGPLIGPDSDKVPGGESAAGNQSTPMNAQPNKAAGRDSANTAAVIAAEAPANENGKDQDSQEQETAEETEEKPEPVPSRSMTIKNNQFLDVIYPGSGWIYLGEEGSGDHFIFQGRKLGKGETTFTLRSKEPGVALLRFYKNDILTGNYIDDYIQISITDKSATDASHVEAPSYAEVVPPKFDRTKAVEEKKAAQAAAKPAESAPQKESSFQSADEGQKAASKETAQADKKEAAQEAPSEKVQTVIQTSGQEKSESKQKTSVAGTSSPAAEEDKKESALDQNVSGGTDKAKSLLERAQKAYDEKRYAEALDLVQQFFDTASEDFDAGLYLEGLILEAKSEVRNIKSAIGAYDTLIKNWPQSNYWRRANERSIYLKRFYIDIR